MFFYNVFHTVNCVLCVRESFKFVFFFSPNQFHPKPGVTIAEVAFFVEALQDSSRKLNWPWLFLNRDFYLKSTSSETGNNLSLKRDNPADIQIFDRDIRAGVRSDYVNLCETTTRKFVFEDPDYEYQPPFFHEVLCKNVASDEKSQEMTTMQKCVDSNFHCIQRSRTLLMARRKWSEDCWEPFTRVVASSCDCMWPTTVLGDVSVYY